MLLPHPEACGEAEVVRLREQTSHATAQAMIRPTNYPLMRPLFSLSESLERLPREDPEDPLRRFQGGDN